MDSEDRDVKTINFASGSAAGEIARDRVCIGSHCGTMDFIQLVDESDDPFKGAEWDGIMGLGLKISDGTDFNAMTQLLENASQPVLSIFLSNDADSSLDFGRIDESKMDGKLQWNEVSDPGYWQLTMKDFVIGGKESGICGKT